MIQYITHVYNIQLELSASVQEEEAESLRNKIISLWDRLDISVEFRDDFLSKHQGYKSWIIDEVHTHNYTDRYNYIMYYIVEIRNG